MGTSNVAWGFTLLLVIASLQCEVDALQSHYYLSSCPAAEATVAAVVTNAVFWDKRVGAAMIRMFFHDCFVQGCDASILIDSPTQTAEKDSRPNLTLHSFEVIDAAKTAVELICRQTVSCADILAFAASTSLALLGGPIIDIQGGRLDGLVSSISEPLTNIPSPLSTLSQLQTTFSNKGLDTEDMVVLSGAHTIGKSHCNTFANRLSNFSSSSSVDPSLDVGLAASLAQSCPATALATTVVDNDVKTPTFFDNAYYKNVANGKGLLTSDAELYTDSSTKILVDRFAANDFDFLAKFGQALCKMGEIGVKTGVNGNIRTNCRSFS